MYEKRFGLSRRPFAVSAEAPAYYPSSGHELVLKALLAAIQEHQAFAVLTGEPGTGKTLILHRLAESLDSQRLMTWISNTHLPDPAALFQTLLYDLERPREGKSEQELRLAVTDLLLQSYQAGKPVILLIDEAHHLRPELLEELRLLTNLEARDGKALQVVLAGLPSSLQTLRLPELASLSQRIGVQLELGGMGVHEAVDYLVHQLRAAGGRPERIITEEALETLARGTLGVPRLLNKAGSAAFRLAFLAEQPMVDAEAVMEALSELGLGAEQTMPAAGGAELRVLAKPSSRPPLGMAS